MIAQHNRRHPRYEFLRFLKADLRLVSPPQRHRPGSRHPQVDHEWNKNPKPFVWTESADDILETLADYAALTVPSIRGPNR